MKKELKIIFKALYCYLGFFFVMALAIPFISRYLRPDKPNWDYDSLQLIQFSASIWIMLLLCYLISDYKQNDKDRV